MVLPDPRLTPGAANPQVNQGNIDSTISVSGWTSTVRPDSSYTTAVKIRQLDAGYNLRGDTATGDYEEDHLISLELGGSPTVVKNLWPEPYGSKDGARIKDQIENKLHDLVCAGRIPLRRAQRAIAANWWRAHQRFMPMRLHPRPVHSYTPPPPPPATRTYHPPVQHPCTTTSSGSCIQGGEFCPQADYGMTGYDAYGDAYVCTGDTTHPHWET